jgi:assimilatory nitrate reductase catalytic subunit
MREVATHCPYCALQCAMILRDTPGGRVEVDAGEGGLCQKGWTAAELLDHPDRLRTPLIAGRPASWDEAYSLIVSKIMDVQSAHGRDAVAVFGGGGLTNEKCYSLGKFARVALGTKHIDYNGRFCMSSAAAAGIRAFGVDRGLPFPMEDLSTADTLLLVGANVAETMPPFARFLTRQRDNGGVQIVVDPRATPTARAATLHLQPTPGTDLALALGLLHLVIAPTAVDQSYVDERTPAGTPYGAAWRVLARPRRADHRRPDRRPRVHRPRARRGRRSSSPRAAPSSTARASTPSPR